MSSNESQASSAAVRPGRTVSIRVALWISLIIVLGISALWGVQWYKMLKRLRASEQARLAAVRQSAYNVAKSIAIFANKQIVSRNYRELQDFSDNLVRSRPIAFVAIADSRGRFVAHTNREFLGKKLDQEQTSDNLIEASVPVMDFTKQVGTVQVGIRVK